MFPATVPLFVSVTLLIPLIYLPAAAPELPELAFVGAVEGKLILVPEPFAPLLPFDPAAPKAPPFPPEPPAPALVPPADAPLDPEPAEAL